MIRGRTFDTPALCENVEVGIEWVQSMEARLFDYCEEISLTPPITGPPYIYLRMTQRPLRDDS